MVINNSKSIPQKKEKMAAALHQVWETVQQAGHFRCHVSAVFNFWNR